MTDKHFVAEVAQNMMSVRISMGKESLTLDASEMDVVIRELSHRRALLADMVPFQLEPNAMVETVTGPMTAVGKGGPDGDLLIMRYRHPGYGWQAIGFTEEDARKIKTGFERVLLLLKPKGVLQ